MDIRTILVPVADSVTARQALTVAIPLARRFDAHLIALHVRYDPTAPIPYVAGPIPADVLVELSAGAEKLAIERAARLKAMVETVFAEAGLATDSAGGGAAASGEWREDTGSIDYRYGVTGRLYDLAVVVHPSEENPDMIADVLEGLLFHSGRPVLMLPEGVTSVAGSTIAIAWNGSREGARAVSAAMPFLKGARRIVAVTADSATEANDRPNAAALAESLKWHGLAVEVMQAPDAEQSDGMAILKAAEGIGADLLVTGAYSHSRLRELILGGVTRDIVTKAMLPVLFSH